MTGLCMAVWPLFSTLALAPLAQIRGHKKQDPLSDLYAPACLSPDGSP